MSFFEWSMVFVGLGIIALAALVLLGLRLWRGIKDLGREAARAGDALSRIGAAAASDRD
jgi:hypothetical protein